jgi:hypothetical protein
MVAGQPMEKSGNNSLQKKGSGTSRLANTSTRTIMGSNGHSTESVDDNERVGMAQKRRLQGNRWKNQQLQGNRWKNQGIILSKRKHQNQHQVQVD